MLLGVAWSVISLITGCYLGVTWVVIFCCGRSQNTRVSQTQTFERNHFHLEMSLGPAPGLAIITWLL